MPYTRGEISLRDFFLKIQSSLRYFLKKWYITFFCCVLGFCIGYLYLKKQSPIYEGVTTFVLASDTKSSGIMGLASQFGIDVNSGGGDVFTGENIILLFRSRALLQRALFQVIPNTRSSLLNYYCSRSKLFEKWGKNPRLEKAIPLPDNADHLNNLQDSLAREVYDVIINNNLSVNKIDKKASFYEVRTSSNDQMFSFLLNQNLVRVTTEFYIETKTKLARQNLKMLQGESDSLKTLLGNTISSGAAVVDQTFGLNPAYQIHRAPIQKFQSQSAALASAYSEVVKNVELAKITLQKETPLLEIVDNPSLPLRAITVSKTKVIIGSMIISLLASIVIIFALKVYSELREYTKEQEI
ncbi:MAG: lipopolysaccharide biosynthesis protein [Chitinophagaceae bacterium]|nr:lipopolysaccharide biosynthesis protein [Chitinophagaceae bacterium]